MSALISGSVYKATFLHGRDPKPPKLLALCMNWCTSGSTEAASPIPTRQDYIGKSPDYTQLKATLIDQFADKMTVFRPLGVNRYDIEVENVGYKIENEMNRGNLLCRLAFSPQTCTDRRTGTTNCSRQSADIVPLPCSSGEICFLAQHSPQFNSDMRILFTTISSRLLLKLAMP